MRIAQPEHALAAAAGAHPVQICRWLERVRQMAVHNRHGKGGIWRLTRVTAPLNGHRLRIVYPANTSCKAQPSRAGLGLRCLEHGTFSSCRLLL
jgi:hypothetical protein